jgi:hypothetical protein
VGGAAERHEHRGELSRSALPLRPRDRRETAEILADPSALRGLAEARESEQSGDVVYGAGAARALLAERKR